MSAALPPWPKGAFPEKYTARSVMVRLEGAWSLELREESLARVRALGLTTDPARSDRVLVVLGGDVPLASVRDALGGAPISAFRWRAGRRDDRVRDRASLAIGLSPSADPVDALVAVGVASPEHGIGTAALVRFVTSLRGFADRVTLDGLAEDWLKISLTPRSDVAAIRIAARARELCAPLAAGHNLEALAASLRELGSLGMSWAPVS